MQAIIQTGGKQLKVQTGDVVCVELLGADVGADVTFDDVRLVSGEGGTRIGSPRVDGVVVKATVLDRVKGPKLRSVKYRRRKDSKTVKGHRQSYHKVRITGIDG